MSIERRLVGPAFEQGQPVRIERALEYFELLTARLPHALLAARLVCLSEFGTLSRRGANCDDKTDCHTPPPCVDGSRITCVAQAVRSPIPPRQGSPLSALCSLADLVFWTMFRFNSCYRNSRSAPSDGTSILGDYKRKPVRNGGPARFPNNGTSAKTRKTARHYPPSIAVAEPEF